MENLGGQKMRLFRLRSGRSQIGLAAEVAATRQAWGDWEKGNRIPRPQYMHRLVGMIGDLDPGDFYKPAAADLGMEIEALKSGLEAAE